MNNFKLSFVFLMVAQAVVGYAAAADYNAAQDGVITTNKNFAARDVVMANIENALSAGTVVNFTDHSNLLVSVAKGLSAGTQNFHGNSFLLASTANAISGGIQNFSDSSRLRVTANNALAAGTINLYGNSDIQLEKSDLNSNALAINLADVGTKLGLYGQKATVGQLKGKGTVSFGSFPNGTLTIDTSTLGTSTFEGVLDTSASTNAQLIKQGRGEWIFNGTTTGPGGKANVAGGLLTVNGDLSSFITTVNNGASLGGTGKVGSTTVNSGGGLGVGDSKGVLSINGDLTMQRYSTLYVHADEKGRAGRIDVSGNANVGHGLVQVLADSGRYAANTRFTILSAANGVTGEFLSVFTDLYFLSATLHHNANSVEVELRRNAKNFVSVAKTPSATNVAQVIGDNAPVLRDHLFASSSATASVALDQLAGAANASRVAAMTASTAQVGSSLLNAATQFDSQKNSLQASMLRSDGPLLVSSETPADARGLRNPDAGRLWVQALGSSGNFDSPEHSRNLQQQTTGGLLGMDWAAGEAWRVGVAAGHSKTSLNAGDYLDGAVNSYHLGTYARYKGDTVVTRMGLAYSGHTGKSQREVDFSGFRDSPRSNYKANAQQAFVEAALPTANGNLAKEPFASLGYQRYSREAYDEKGGAAALRVDDQQQGNLISTLGFRVARHSVLDNGMSLIRRASLGWRHAYGETAVTTRQSFLSGGSSFDVYGSALNRNSLMLEGGLDLGISAAQNLGLNYVGEVGSEGRNHGLNAEWRLSF